MLGRGEQGESGYFLGFQNNIPYCEVFLVGLHFSWGSLTLLTSREHPQNQGFLDQHILKKCAPGQSLFAHFFYCIIIHIVPQHYSGSLLHYFMISLNIKAVLETFSLLLIFLLLKMKCRMKFSFTQQSVGPWIGSLEKSLRGK